MLKPGGRLVAIMSEGPFFRWADQGFRDWLDEVGGESEQLPPDAFKASGTGVNSRLVTISKAEANPVGPIFDSAALSIIGPAAPSSGSQRGTSDRLSLRSRSREGDRFNGSAFVWFPARHF